MLPILFQNVVTNLVSLVDNIMVGQVGTEPMSGVAIANQLIFVFLLSIFGGLSGAGIYTSQFYGQGNKKGIANTFRMKVYLGIACVAIFAIVFFVFGKNLINIFLHQGNENLDMNATFDYGMHYLRLMTIQMIPFMIMQVYSTTLRECGETMLPLKASLIAVACNVVGNYILIFGKLGLPALGVTGAAIATIIARFVECGILIIYTHSHKDRFSFISEVFKTFKIPIDLAKEMIKKTMPLLINEFLWSAGMAMLNQCYSMRGLEVVSATNISSTVVNLFACGMLAMGNTISIMVGQRLGQGKLKEAVEEDKILIVLTLIITIILAGVLALCAKPISNIYNTTEMIKNMATRFMWVSAIFMSFDAVTTSCYFTLRSGGKTFITFIFDSFFLWVFFVSTAFILSRFTSLPIFAIYFIVNSFFVVKSIIGLIMVNSKKWVVNLVENK